MNQRNAPRPLPFSRIHINNHGSNSKCCIIEKKLNISYIHWMKLQEVILTISNISNLLNQSQSGASVKVILVTVHVVGHGWGNLLFFAYICFSTHSPLIASILVNCILRHIHLLYVLIFHLVSSLRCEPMFTCRAFDMLLITVLLETNFLLKCLS